MDGVEVFEPVRAKSSKKLQQDKYRHAEVHTECGPYSEIEFLTFIKGKDEALVDSVINAGQLLKQIEGLPRKEALKNTLADYIIDELVINQVMQKHPDKESCKAYAYYRMLYNKTWPNEHQKA